MKLKVFDSGNHWMANKGQYSITSVIPPPQSNKYQKPTTPEKGIDECTGAGCLLDNSCWAVQCDECDQPEHGTCVKTND